MDVGSTLEAIFGQLAKLGRPVAQRRRRGLAAHQVAERFSAAGLNCHPDVAAAYAISDGTDAFDGDTIGDLSFFPGYYWLSIEDALTTYRALKPDGRWREDWVPLFASGGGDFYAVVCSDRELAFGGMVGFILGEPDHLIEFPNLGAMLTTVWRSFEEKAFHVTPEGDMEADYPAMLVKVSLFP